ncbi:hypothetical protein MP228_000988 [Amoeboaphelidium protococcarum]|nr:hypothetical protein MP228_000988 [Amoeboaphelidium protococcarum]
MLQSAPSGNGNKEMHQILQLSQTEGSLEFLNSYLKNNIAACKELEKFLRKKGQCEEDYAKEVRKLVNAMPQSPNSQAYDSTSVAAHSGGNQLAKVGTFSQAWDVLKSLTSSTQDDRSQYGKACSQHAAELQQLIVTADKNRKQIKNSNNNDKSALSAAENRMNHSKIKFEDAHKEVERHQTSEWDGTSSYQQSTQSSLSLKNVFGKKKSLQDKHMDARNVQNAFAANMADFDSKRHEYLSVKLPGYIKDLKELCTETDTALKAYMLQYAKLMNESIQHDVSEISGGSSGLTLIEKFNSIDGQRDFSVEVAQFIQCNGVAGGSSSQILQSAAGRGDSAYNRQDSFYESAASVAQDVESIPGDAIKGLSLTANSSTDTSGNNGQKVNRQFGVDLEYLVERDGVDVPVVLEQCFQAVESYGLNASGLYRLNPSATKLQKLKRQFDNNAMSVNLYDPEWSSDVHAVCGVVKEFLSSLPSPVLTAAFQQKLVQAGRMDQPKKRLIAVHEIVNQLPDANYLLVKRLGHHLVKVAGNSAANRMTCSALASVFGPLLMYASKDGVSDREQAASCKVVETLLEGYTSIFDTDI